MTTVTAHIHLDDAGIAWIDDTRVKVIEVVLDRLCQGWSAAEIHFQHPHLSMAQVYAALSYYYDHEVELGAQITQRLTKVEEMAAEAAKGGDSPVRRRLRAAGNLP